MTKTQELLHTLKEKVSQLAIAWYLKEEVISSLKYLHRYKLSNIEKNWNIFCDYLLFLDLQNTDKIKKLGTKVNKIQKEKTEIDLEYFLSLEKVTKQQKATYLKKIQENGYELLTLIQWIKWVLVLSIDEFCNASKTRMDIHQLLMKREPEHKKLKV